MTRLCAEPGCPNLTERPARYCSRHQPAKPSGTPGYGTSRWRRTRDAYIAQHPTCERCHTSPALDVHHKDGRHPDQPGANDWHNLQALCRACHRLLTEHPEVTQ